MKTFVLVLAMAAICGCTTVPAVGAGLQLDPQSGNQCRVHCQALGRSSARW
jgi:hypothetical protein